MADKLHAIVEQSGEKSVVKLAGYLDEDNNLGTLVEQIPAGTAEIDLAGVERINSVGIRDWVNWLAALDANGTRTILVACSPAIVAQINLVKNFAGRGAVHSFQIPYHCSECDEEKTILVETADMQSPGAEPPTCTCDECGRAMDVDEMPESYFAFLGQASLRPSDSDLARGSSADVAKVIKPRVKTRERKSSPPERQSRPSLSAFQTPSQGSKRTSSSPLLTKRQSDSRIALGSSQRISGERISATRIEFPAKRASAPIVPTKSNTLLVGVLVFVLMLAIAALAYVVITQ